MKQPKLNYRFHNPNTVEATADILLEILIEANREKAEDAIRQAVLKTDPPQDHDT